MRVLMTTDAVGGVWQYSLALARGLVERWGCRVMLVCLGDPPAQDLVDACPQPGVELVALPLKLEWMRDGAEDVAEGLRRVARLAEEWRPDLIHSNQFCFGLLSTPIPRVVVAHSDVLSWRVWHRGDVRLPGALADQLEADLPLRAYRDLVAAGLAGASAVVCPSHFMSRSLLEIYGVQSTVLYNGLWPDLYASGPKENVALVAGRLWDEAKGAATAVRAVEGLPLELQLLGPTEGPTGERAYLPAAGNARYLGSLGWRETRALVARARLYLATSSYEPFGLAALESALSGCALVAADTPAYREVWGDAALYYRSKDHDHLRRQLLALLGAPQRVDQLAGVARERALKMYTADRMTDGYHALYRSLVGRGSRLQPANSGDGSQPTGATPAGSRPSEAGLT